ncbi:MAG: DUF2147 domain-containing protein [Chitinophagales bacterium]|jgi:uncharacterized protein (DUF2147 family)|nr:DUF2147 domain-containing protein [Sphingobacteriales bacterium]
MRLILLLITIIYSLSSYAQSYSPVGTWVTIDDETGKEKSHVEVFEKDGKLYGKIVRLLLKPQNAVCEVCDGDRKNKSLVGMIIISNMKKKGDKWEGGKIYKADAGKEYNGFLKMSGPDKLIVTGKVLFITKSQIWKRFK